MFKNVIESPWVGIGSGSILLFTSLFETFHNVEAGLGAHHGLALFAVVQILQAVPHLRDAARDITGSDKEN